VVVDAANITPLASPLMHTAIRVRSDDGSEVAAYDFGGTGPALLLGHATGFHAHAWLPVVAGLRARFRCYAWDARGHGASGPPASGDFAWRRSGEDARAVAAAFGLDRPLAAGHSGSGAALILAEADHPGSWHALWLFEPVVPEPAAIAGDNPLEAVAMRRKDRFASRQDALANFAAKPPFASFAPEALRLYVEHGFLDEPDGSVTLACRREDEAATYHEAVPANARARMPAMRLPVHVAVGALSTHFPPAAFAEAVALLPDGTLEVLGGVGHFGPFEDPPLVAASITAALG